MIKYIKFMIRHWWRFLYIRKNEFHISYELDTEYLIHCKPKGGVIKHYNDLSARREIAHKRGLKNG